MKRLMTYRFLCIWAWLLAFIGYSLPTIAQGSAASHLYAVLLSGGRNKLMNHERYWNDCSFLYRTLRQRYGLPKRNITVLMSDGGIPERDMLKADGTGFVSSPVDLDGDGQSDVQYAATRQMLVDVLTNLSRQLTADDHLLLFFTDHGGTDGSSVYLWLWNEERLTDAQLASLLSPLRVKSLCVVISQCYAGGFIDHLQLSGRVVAASSRSDEVSWACPDRDYDEFVYHWTCAVNGADEQGTPVHADVNADGWVSAAEAFRYAHAHDRRPETPQFASWPEDLGERWTLDGLLETGIREVATDPAPAQFYSLSGIRQLSVPRGQLHLVRQGGKIRKVVR